jgi:hypothetical protein
MKQTAVEWLANELCYVTDSGKYIIDNTDDVTDIVNQALQMEQEQQEQQEYEWDNCKKIIHEGFVYVKYNDIIQCKKSLNNCT